MNREKVKIPLEGFSGPIFPRIVDELNTICDKIRLDGAVLAEMAKNLKSPFFSFDAMSTLTTGDDHGCCVLHFETSLGKIAVLFPQTNKRSVAVYADGELKRGPQSCGEFKIVEIDSVLEALKQALQALDQAENKPQEASFVHHT